MLLHQHTYSIYKTCSLLAFSVFATFLTIAQGLVCTLCRLTSCHQHVCVQISSRVDLANFSILHFQFRQMEGRRRQRRARRREEEGEQTAAIQQPELESTSCIFNEPVVRSDSEKAQTTLGYLVPLKATNEMNKCFFFVYEVNSEVGEREGGEAGREVWREKRCRRWECGSEQGRGIGGVFSFTSRVTFKMLFISPQQGSC